MANIYGIPGISIIEHHQEYTAAHVDPVLLTDPYSALRFLEQVRLNGYRVVFQGETFVVLEPLEP